MLARLDRIEELRRGTSGARVLLTEIQLLLAEAEAWVLTDQADERARQAVGHVRTALAQPDSAAVGPKRTLVA